MILQALTDYYETLAQKGKIARPGWAKVKVSYALEIDENGQLIQIHPLKIQDGKGKKMLPREINLPSIGEAKGNGIKSNFTWENGSYLLGLHFKGDLKRTIQCYETAKRLHLALLSECNDPFAKAICLFFKRWDYEAARDNAIISEKAEELSSSNIVFLFNNTYPNDNRALSEAWQKYYEVNDDGIKMRCLVTGNSVIPAAIHPPIGGVWGAQSSGAALVSFNAPAYCSYNREQNINAPVGKYAAFAYTTTLNNLLSDRKHVKHIGDTTLVYWAENAEPAYQDAFSDFLDGGDAENKMTDNDMDYYMEAISEGKQVSWDGIPLHPDNRFYVLGLAPNAARLSVRFFLRDGFGSFVKHIREHYKNLQIVSDQQNKFLNIPLWKLLSETVRIIPGKAIPESLPQMSGDTLRAILTGGLYPATLYQQAQIRIKAEQNITRGRAAIIKAYLIRNTDNEKYKEALQVELNENTTYQPYVLGRLFSVAEAIQEKASGVTTIKDKYFSSASTTPAVVFPLILKLVEIHLKKLDGGIRVNYAKQLGELTGLVRETYQKHYGLYDQGVFQLGYYHQTQKRYEKKEKNDGAVNAKELKEDK